MRRVVLRLTRPRNVVIPLVFGGLAFLLSSASFAAGGGRRNPALAEQLFEEGKVALTRGDEAAACAAFSASQAADPSVGALLNVARCHEKNGKTATAWTEFRAAATLANQRGDEGRRRGAQDLADTLEKTLSRISVEVSPQHADVAVRIDSQSLPAVGFGVPLPVDPGEHLVEASAKGYAPWSSMVPIAADGSRLTVLVPVLAEREGEPDAGRKKVIAGVVLGGVGLAALLAGAVQAVRSVEMDRTLEHVCTPPDSDGARACETARSGDVDRLTFTANSASVLLASGGVVSAAGVVLLIAAQLGREPTDEGAPQALVVRPILAPSLVGLSLVGSF